MFANEMAYKTALHIHVIYTDKIGKCLIYD